MISRDLATLGGLRRLSDLIWDAAKASDTTMIVPEKGHKCK